MKKEEIERLIDKYFDGETSNAEEQQLRDYFTTHGQSVDKEWQPLRALMAYECRCIGENEHAGQYTDEVADMDEALSEKAASNRRHVASLWSRRWLWPVSVAASVVLLVTLFLSFPREGNSDYAIIDGEKYTGKAIVEKEAEAALSLVAVGDDDFHALEQMQ